MKCFTIENETNNIMVHASVEEAEAIPDSARFDTEAGLGELAANWPSARLVEIWNSLPGITPVAKFKDRTTGVSRIWKALQSLGQFEASPDTEQTEAAQSEAVIADGTDFTTKGDVAPQTPDVAEETVPAKTTASRAKKTPKTATEPGTPREGSKTSQVIAMLKRESGVTLEQIMAEMGWQKHTTRAMLSAGGSLTKNHGLVIVSEKVDDRRVYSIKG